jgi:bifunctional ADP-heptose synthase (sugar kinase/adenylyltransferase)
LIKGGDYDPEERDQNSPRYMVGSDIVRQKGGEVKSIPLLKGFSTTGTIRKIREKE